MARQTTRSGAGSKTSGRGGSATSARGRAASTSKARGAAARRSGAAKSGATRTGKASAASRAKQASRATPKDLGDLFLETLKDIYHAEKQILRALPKMAKAAQSSALRQAFESHARETQTHAERLERVFEMSGKRPQAKTCHAIMGLVEEANEVMKEFKGSDALDAGLLAAAQAVEHYEISRYGTLRSWAAQHGMHDVARLLDETLAEEKKTDQLLTQIAEGNVNREAA